MKNNLFAENIPKNYTITYSSPYYWLYNEDTNELIMKDVDHEKVIDKKIELISKNEGRSS